MNAADATGFASHLPACDSRRSATSSAATAAAQATIGPVVSNATPCLCWRPRRIVAQRCGPVVRAASIAAPMSERSRPFVLRAGPRALRHLLDRGLAPGDIDCVPAAAGGPKGLALLPFDRLLLQHGWLPEEHPVELIGASVGAWRMAALAQVNPLDALDRVQYAYVHEQCYSARPTPPEVSTACRRIAAAVRGVGDLRWRSGVRLSIVTSRARGP